MVVHSSICVSDAKAQGDDTPFKARRERRKEWSALCRQLNAVLKLADDERRPLAEDEQALFSATLFALYELEGSYLGT
ncbi:MAG: hypothetical protein KKC79_01815 [Gammaproteobacteria bacterium]|nr:hypothetical protein [Gammaproteobacteria bacterium]MBU1441784.1 hypothetical protein [Gammaproteobacteria bacterium]MBU2407367.1 hypothetical protein [Gammaproteobacteria bacterium]